MTHHRRKRVLVLEDEPVLASVFSEVLTEAAGCDVTIAEDGVAAAQALAAGPGFDLALLDLLVPRLSGVEVAASAAARGIPVLLSSGDLLAARAAAELGFAVLVKPFALDMLVREVRGRITTANQRIAAARANKARLIENIRLLREEIHRLR